MVTELRQIAVARALVLLNDKEDAEDVAGEVLMRHKCLKMRPFKKIFFRIGA